MKGVGRLLVGLLIPGALAAQTPFAGYAPGQFACTTLLETGQTDLRSEVAGTTRSETVQRTGRWRMLGTPAPGGVQIEAWYDSLALERRTPDGPLVPDTDGMLGGRFRGVLTADGRWRGDARPFVPDDVAQVADVGAAMNSLLPVLPPFDLRPGGTWTDSTGLAVERLADSLAGGTRLLRFHYFADRTGAPELHLPDPLPGATEHVRAEGRAVVDPKRGVLEYERKVVTETGIPAGGPFRAAVRTSAVERFRLRRLADGRGAECQ